MSQAGLGAEGSEVLNLSAECSSVSLWIFPETVKIEPEQLTTLWPGNSFSKFCFLAKAKF